MYDYLFKLPTGVSLLFHNKYLVLMMLFYPIFGFSMFVWKLENVAAHLDVHIVLGKLGCVYTLKTVIT